MKSFFKGEKKEEEEERRKEGEEEEEDDDDDYYYLNLIFVYECEIRIMGVEIYKNKVIFNVCD